MFDLQNMTYGDFLNANTNYKNANNENYLDALNISLDEEQSIAFEKGQVVMYIGEFIQNDIGQFKDLIEVKVIL